MSPQSQGADVLKLAKALHERGVVNLDSKISDVLDAVEVSGVARFADEIEGVCFKFTQPVFVIWGIPESIAEFSRASRLEETGILAAEESAL